MLLVLLDFLSDCVSPAAVPAVNRSDWASMAVKIVRRLVREYRVATHPVLARKRSATKGHEADTTAPKAMKQTPRHQRP